MTDDTEFSPPSAWQETRFERGAFGPDGRQGFAATLMVDDATLAVVPVRYRREGGEERLEAIDEDWSRVRDGPTVSPEPLEPTTAFAARLTQRSRGRDRETVLTVAADAGDALAPAGWLAAAATDADDLRRQAEHHAGVGAAGPGRAVLSDDDVLTAYFADEPERCVLTGTRTRSHRIELPYRYVQVLDGTRRTDRGVLRFPSTVRALVGVVSHGAWEDDGLAEVDFGAPLERVEAGRYRLDGSVVEAIRGADSAAFSLTRLDE